MGSRFVRPDTSVLRISDGDTLTVKRRLNSGEQRAAFAAMYVAGVDGEFRVNALEVGITRMLAYLLDWSLLDEDGRPVVIREQPASIVRARLDELDPNSFDEIREAIDSHEQAMQAERSAEKNVLDGARQSPAISPSLDAVAGELIGSAH